MNLSRLEDWERRIIEEADQNGLTSHISLSTEDVSSLEPYEIHQDPKLIDEIAGSLAQGEKTPPIWITSSRKLMDGHHRLLAHIKEGRWGIEVYEVDQRLYDVLKEDHDFSDLDIIDLLKRLNEIDG